ncbi:MAG: DNA cytosine methyltransferase [Rhizobiaceae bacterium]
MKSLELFAGAGGLAIGLHKAGFEPENVIEWDAHCCDTINANIVRGHRAVEKWHLTRGDVKSFDFSAYEDQIELISGGPPCQPFSMGGKHKAYNDDRDMFPQAIRAVRETRPKAFIFENVKGLTRSSFRNYFEYIRQQLQFPEIVRKPDEDWIDHLARLEQHYTSGSREGLTYRVVPELLNAANFGIPQKRERVFFVGFREDLGVRWHFPVATHSREALLWDMSRGSYWERHEVPSGLRIVPEDAAKVREWPASSPWQTVRDALVGLPEPTSSRSEDCGYLNHRLQQGAKSYPGHTGSQIDEPAKTLKAGVHGVPGGENMMLKTDGSVRYFSVRESARLQTFPDDFLFQGSWTESMRQLGNAVPVKLAHLLGASVKSHLERAA